MTRALRGLDAPVRTYPRALAEQLAACRPGDVRLKLLNSLYASMEMGDKIRVQTHLSDIQRERRVAELRRGNVVRLPSGALP